MNTSAVSTASPRAASWLVALGFVAIYLVWGSTYLAMRIAVETLPPLAMAGIRFTFAGSLLMLWLWMRGTPLPAAGHWRSAWISGGLLFLGGNGLVVWAEREVPSGLAALLVATIPLWMAIMDWARPGGKMPAKRASMGILVGLIGVALLFTGKSDKSVPSVLPVIGLWAIVIASASWAAGSLFARTTNKPGSVWMWTAVQMLCGGLLLLTAATLTGEFRDFSSQASHFSGRSIAAFFYLIVFGSWIGFGTFVWLLQVSSPAKVSTYAYVNPIVALFLGWAFGGEALSGMTFVSAAVVLVGVILMTLSSNGATGSGRGK